MNVLAVNVSLRYFSTFWCTEECFSRFLVVLTYMFVRSRFSPWNTDIALGAAKKRKKVFAVGTSTVRSLETVAVSGFQVSPKRGWTDKFIYPPYDFKMVDAMITNFHQPKSTLLMMISAFADRDLIMKAYREAKKNNYRFLSYGDAMLIM